MASFSKYVEFHDPRLALDVNAEDALADVVIVALLHNQSDKEFPGLRDVEGVLHPGSVTFHVPLVEQQIVVSDVKPPPRAFPVVWGD